MAPWILPAIIVGALGSAWYKASQAAPAEVINAASKATFDTALTSLTDPVKLRAMAGAFQASGFAPQAALLLKRAELFSTPADVAAMNESIFKEALASTKVPGILAAADHFQSIGAMGAAQELRFLAAGVTAMQTITLPDSPIPKAAQAKPTKGGGGAPATPASHDPSNEPPAGTSSLPQGPASPSSLPTGGAPASSLPAIPTSPAAAVSAVKSVAAAIPGVSGALGSLMGSDDTNG